MGIRLTKEVKDLYNQNYSAMEKEAEQGIRRWTNISCSWTSTTNVIKMAML